MKACIVVEGKRIRVKRNKIQTGREREKGEKEQNVERKGSDTNETRKKCGGLEEVVFHCSEWEKKREKSISHFRSRSRSTAFLIETTNGEEATTVSATQRNFAQLA
jgi:hypothetical protein